MSVAKRRVEEQLAENTGDEIRAKWTELRESNPDVYREKIRTLETTFGKHKKIIDSETGIAYRVPIEVIVTEGIVGCDLSDFPRWEDQP